MSKQKLRVRILIFRLSKGSESTSKMASSFEKQLGKIWKIYTKWHKAQKLKEKKKEKQTLGRYRQRAKIWKKVHEKEKQSRSPGQTDIHKEEQTL